MECLPSKWRMDQVAKRWLGWWMWKTAKAPSAMTQVCTWAPFFPSIVKFLFFVFLIPNLALLIFTTWVMLFYSIVRLKRKRKKKDFYDTVGLVSFSQSISSHPLQSSKFLFLKDFMWIFLTYWNHTSASHYLTVLLCIMKVTHFSNRHQEPSLNNFLCVPFSLNIIHQHNYWSKTYKLLTLDKCIFIFSTRSSWEYSYLCLGFCCWRLCRLFGCVLMVVVIINYQLSEAFVQTNVKIWTHLKCLVYILRTDKALQWT